MQINFYHHTERLVAVGKSDYLVNLYGGRRDIFDIADDEKLIGCVLEYGSSKFLGITWLKWKIPSWKPPQAFFN